MSVAGPRGVARLALLVTLVGSALVVAVPSVPAPIPIPIALVASLLLVSLAVAAGTLRVTTVVLIGMGTLCLSLSLLPAWGATWNDGRRYQVGLTGVRWIVTPQAAVSAAPRCNWYTGGGDRAALCRPAAGAGWRYRLMQIALPCLVLAVAAALSVALRLVVTRTPARRLEDVALPLLLAMGLAATGALLLLRNAGAALAVLGGSELGFGGSAPIAAGAGVVLLAAGIGTNRARIRR
ncbi:MAG: hypothetical protein ABR559_04825 [Gemmatimonadota bacterium]